MFRRMPAIPRQKACIACADSKRRCDKQLPECQRCLDRDVDCTYPQPKRRRRIPTARGDSPAGAMALSQNYADADADTLGSNLDVGDWGAAGAVDFGISLSDGIIPCVPALPPSAASPAAQELVLGSGSSNAPCPWFLRDETWTMEHCGHEPACATFVELEPFIHAVEEMLQC